MNSKFKELIAMYGYELAEARQQPGTRFINQAHLLEGLALMHMQRQIIGAIDEYFDTVGIEADSYIGAYATIESVQAFLHEAVGLSEDQKTLAEIFSKEWVESLENRDEQ